MKILVLNSGSSSQKTCLYEISSTLPENPPPCLWQGKIEWDGEFAASEIRNSRGVVSKERLKLSSRSEALERLLKSSWSGEARTLGSPSEIDVVGHRVVHGGPHYAEPVIITADVRSAIAAVAGFAPLHNRAELDGMELIEKLLGSVPQVAVFDTGFHRHLPSAASVYPGPYEWFTEGIRRYGFHGINHQYCAHRAARLLRRDLRSLKLVSCHLGNGCSLAAIEAGRSIDTTMGFTPLEGLMMGTRSGSIDPGILIYLLRQKKLSAQELDNVLNNQSGLLGISGFSGDMRKILAGRNAGEQRARLAFDIYVHRLRSGIGAMIASLGGIDALVFTAGVGENSPQVRTAACQQFEFIGLKLDGDANNNSIDSDRDIAAPDSRVRVLVIHAQEDWQIATECWQLVRTSAVQQKTS